MKLNIFEINSALLYPLRLSFYILLALILLSSTTQKATNSKALSQVKVYVEAHASSKKQFERNTSQNITVANAYDVSGSLPSGYVKDGSKDYTTYIQQALDAHDDIVFPAFPLLVNETGLKLHSNHNLLFTKGSQLLLKPSSKQNYDIIAIRECNNVSLSSPVIKGDKFSHNGSGGEWGMGIGIYASTNIRITSADISETWGDGIYIGSNSGGTISSDIFIDGAYVRNCRRNGISITSAKNVTLQNPHVADMEGTLPEDGIDVEPNTHADVISNINIISPLTENNKGYGIEFSLSKLYGGENKNIDAMVSDHVDVSSRAAAYISCDPKNAVNGETVNGIITFQTPKWRRYGQNAWDPYGLKEKNIILAIVNPILINDNDQQLDQSAAVTVLKKEIFPETQVYIFNVEL
ncbi:MAG: right-handed parallel beta-helix repeat-containing protein [Flavitalea sp.]